MHTVQRRCGLVWVLVLCGCAGTGAAPTAAAVPITSPGEPRAAECPDGMVLVAAATLPASPGYSWGHVPAHDALRVDGFCLDRTEVTVEAYARCVEAGACTRASETISYTGDGRAQARAAGCNGAREGAQHPINCVDYHQAVAFCAWRGARLPTELEWELAARGPEGRPMPWGDEPLDATRANVRGTETSEALVATDRYAAFDDGWAGTSPVGAFSAGATPEGIEDLAGNVAEWCELAEPAEDDARPVRGAAWSDDDPSTQMLGAHLPSRDRDEFTGFRCAQSL